MDGMLESWGGRETVKVRSWPLRHMLSLDTLDEKRVVQGSGNRLSNTRCMLVTKKPFGLPTLVCGYAVLINWSHKSLRPRDQNS